MNESLSYHHALERLQALHRATPEEFSLWVMHGDIPTYDDEGGRCWVRDALPVWRGSPAEQWGAVKSELFNYRFRSSDLEAFKPTERWLTHAQLLERWAGRLGEEEARRFIQAKAKKMELIPVYPITGFVTGCPEHGVFWRDQVDAVEADLPEPRNPANCEPSQFLTAQAIAGADPAPEEEPKPKRKQYTQSAAIGILTSHVKKPDALKNLFKNESRKPGLKDCRLEGRNAWDLVALFSYMSKHGYLKPEYQTKAAEAFLKSLDTP